MTAEKDFHYICERMNEVELKNQIRQFIAADKLDDAIQLLIAHTSDSEKLDEIIIQLARFNKIKREESNGTMPNSEINNELNLLRNNLLSFTRAENFVVKPPPNPVEYSLNDFEDSFALSFTRVKVAEVFLANLQTDKGITITAIMEQSNLESRKLIVDFINELNSIGLIEKNKHEEKTLWRINDKGKKILEKRIKGG